MPTLGELLGKSKNKMVTFPEDLRINEDGLIVNGLINLEVFRENKTMGVRQIDELTTGYWDCLIDKFDKIVARNKRVVGEIFVSIKFKNYSILKDTISTEFYHGEVNQQLIDEFEEFANKEE